MRYSRARLLAVIVAASVLSSCAATDMDPSAGGTSELPRVSAAETTDIAATEAAGASPAAPDTPSIAPAPPSAAPEPSTPAGSAPSTDAAGPTTTPDFETSPPPSGGWESMEVEVTNESMTDRLSATTGDFRSFVGTLVSTEDSSGCRSQITVTAYHPDGFASGLDFAPGCGGQTAIWGVVDGEWTTLVEMQAVIPCEQIEFNRVPHGHPQLQCLDADGTVIDY